MRSVVLTSNVAHPVSLKLQEMLRLRGDRQEPALVPFDQVEGLTLQGRPEMVAVVLSPAPYRGLDVLRRVRSLVTGPVLAVGQATESKLILRALHEGADHYLDEAELETQLEAVLARLQVKEESSGGELVSIMGASGGTGASTLAVNLAAVLAREHQRCALVDLKPGVGDLTALLDLKPTHTLADLCINARRMDREMFESALVAHSSGISLLAPPQVYDDIRLVTPQGVGQTLKLARELFPFTVADLEDCFHEEQVVALRRATAILLVLRLDFTSLRNTRRILDHLVHIGIDRNRVRLVVNRHGQAKELPAAEAEEALGCKIACLIPDDPKVVNGSNNTGVPVVLKHPSAKVSQSIAQLARSFRPPTGKEASGIVRLAKSFNGWLASFP